MQIRAIKIKDNNNSLKNKLIINKLVWLHLEDFLLKMIIPLTHSLRRILIVEDELIIAMDLAYLLEYDGYNIVGMANNSDDAVDIAFKTQPDIIIMDIDLPGTIDGIAAARIIQEKIFVKIIFVSAHNDQDPRIQKILNEKKAKFIRKPYNDEIIKKLIQEI